MALSSSRTAFTLVEVAIVLAVIGLLVGGVMAGSTLIRNAELRSVTTEYNQFLTSMQSFQNKYNATPGDMRRATFYWGRQVGSGECVTNTGAGVGSPGTCDGDGNGRLDFSSAANRTGEMFQFWRQLSLAGLIQGNYTGLAGSASALHPIIGTNVPGSRIKNAGWGVVYLGDYGGDGNAFASSYGNNINFGTVLENSWLLGAILTPVEVAKIDQKLDDGRPATGIIMPYYWSPCTLATSATDINAEYRLTNNAIACGMYFVNIF